MAPHDLRRPFKRQAISDQQKRRDLSLLRQEQSRRDAQRQARCLATSVLSLQDQDTDSMSDSEPSVELELEIEPEKEQQTQELDVRNAAQLRGTDARKWFAKQLMLPEWMIDIPERLSQDWYVFARPSGKRCFVVSSNGTTVSRLRNGTMLHRFPSSLPSGARTKGNSSSQSYCILDCIFHEADQTYYVIDMVCWGGYSLYECTAEFRFFWLNSKLAESGACGFPSSYHRYKFSMVSIYNCDQEGIQTAYAGEVPYVKDGLLFYNKHAHYQTGNTPLVLVWKDAVCSQYVLDTDSKGQVPVQQQVVLELKDDGKLVTSDDPAVVFGSVNIDFIQKMGLQPGNLLRFSVSNEGLKFTDGKFEKADLEYLGKVNRSRAFADSYSKVMFQYAVRHSPLRIEDLLLACVVNSSSTEEQDSNNCDIMDVIS